VADRLLLRPHTSTTGCGCHFRWSQGFGL